MRNRRQGVDSCWRGKGRGRVAGEGGAQAAEITATVVG